MGAEAGTIPFGKLPEGLRSAHGREGGDQAEPESGTNQAFGPLAGWDRDSKS